MLPYGPKVVLGWRLARWLCPGSEEVPPRPSKPSDIVFQDEDLGADYRTWGFCPTEEEARAAAGGLLRSVLSNPQFEPAERIEIFQFALRLLEERK